MKREIPGESGLGRAIRILEVFDSDRSLLKPAEIARRTSLPSSTTYRIVQEMLALGILRQEIDGVAIGVKLWELATRSSPTIRLRHAARPFLDDLQRTFGHHAQLSILDGSDVVYVERWSATEGPTVENVIDVASRLPAHVSSSGMLLAAYAGTLHRKKIARSAIADGTGGYLDVESFERELAEIRKQGYFRADGWIKDAVSSVAAPIRNRTEVVAAISLFLPNDGRISRAAVPAILVAAAGISRTMGWNRA